MGENKQNLSFSGSNFRNDIATLKSMLPDVAHPALLNLLTNMHNEINELKVKLNNEQEL